ncbi:MAG: class I SAM-dependent methyltransferase [Chloroflexia bacterium]
MKQYHNRTRRSKSIPRELVRARKPYLIPVLPHAHQRLGPRGDSQPGSYRFADHVYSGKPKGRLIIGRWLDSLLLRLPSARPSVRVTSSPKREIRRVVEELGGEDEPIAVLSTPCGYARELFEVVDELRVAHPAACDRLHMHGLDLDPDLIEEVRRRSEAGGYLTEFIVGDALDPADYPTRYDIIISMGFTEFLDDDLALKFYRLMRDQLAAGGTFVTSGMRPHTLSDYLLRNIGEVHTHYRSEQDLRSLCERAGFRVARAYQDPTGLQTMVVAER